MATDDLIQQTIREELADKCVLTIGASSPHGSSARCSSWGPP